MINYMEYDSCMSLISTNLSYGVSVKETLKVLEAEYFRQKEEIISNFAEKVKTCNSLKKRTQAAKNRDLKGNALAQVWENVRDDAIDL